MLTAEIKVNGRLVSVVTIQNVGGDSGPELKGRADYEVGRAVAAQTATDSLLIRVPQSWTVKNWDRSRPAHELVHAAIEAIMEASK